ncbi:hypothetical protein [Streptomyces sp. DB-54]
MATGHMELAAVGTAALAVRTSGAALATTVRAGAQLFRTSLSLDDCARFLAVAKPWTTRCGSAQVTEEGPPLITATEVSFTHPRADRPALDGVPEDKPEWFKPIAPGTVLTRSGNHAYVVLESSELVIGNGTAGHVSIARGLPVLTAGEFKAKGGEVVYLDHKSGHYGPYGENVQQSAIDAFNRNGLNADGEYQAPWGRPDC